jgi:hypothetical protein
MGPVQTDTHVPWVGGTSQGEGYPFGDAGEPMVVLEEEDTKRLMRLKQRGAQRGAFWKGLAGGLVAGLVAGAVIGNFVPRTGASAPPPVAVRVAPAEVEIGRQKARVDELERRNARRIDAESEVARQKARIDELERRNARLADAESEVARQKTRVAELEAFKGRLAEAVKATHDVLKEIDVKGERRRLFGPEGAPDGK